MGKGRKTLEFVQHLWRLIGVDGELLEDLSAVLQQLVFVYLYWRAELMDPRAVHQQKTA
jgi:hypothetical protein